MIAASGAETRNHKVCIASQLTHKLFPCTACARLLSLFVGLRTTRVPVTYFVRCGVYFVQSLQSEARYCPYARTQRLVLDVPILKVPQRRNPVSGTSGRGWRSTATGRVVCCFWASFQAMLVLGQICKSYTLGSRVQYCDCWNCFQNEPLGGSSACLPFFELWQARTTRGETLYGRS